MSFDSSQTNAQCRRTSSVIAKHGLKAHLVERFKLVKIHALPRSGSDLWACIWIHQIEFGLQRKDDLKTSWSEEICQPPPLALPRRSMIVTASVPSQF